MVNILIKKKMHIKLPIFLHLYNSKWPTMLQYTYVCINFFGEQGKSQICWPDKVDSFFRKDSTRSEWIAGFPSRERPPMRPHKTESEAARVRLLNKKASKIQRRVCFEKTCSFRVYLAILCTFHFSRKCKKIFNFLRKKQKMRKSISLGNIPSNWIFGNNLAITWTQDLKRCKKME